MAKRVAIVGAGISGLSACKHIAGLGFNLVVFEADDRIGGVWSHTMETTRLQGWKEASQFSDFPWPSSVTDDFPRATEVLEYLDSYAKHFDLLPYIKLNSKVMSVDYVGESDEEMESWELWGGSGKAFGSNGKWILQVLDTKKGSIKEYEAEFLVLCIGKFSGLPNIPEFPVGSGPEIFSGEVIHSMDYSYLDNAAAAEFIKGKRVVVIGSNKSAVDVSVECALANGNEIPCTMVQRSVHWMVPEVAPWPGGIPLLLFNRLYEMTLHKPGEGLLQSILTTLLSPLRWGINKHIECYLKRKLPLKKYNMIPEDSFVQYASTCTILVLQDTFYKKVEEGSIVLNRSNKFKFCKEGLILDGEDEPLRADIVVFATGYKGDEKLKNMFSRSSFLHSIVGSPNSVIPLYRHMIHPHIPQLAVIGYAESLSNIITYEMKSKWLSFFLNQNFTLPNIKEMERDVEEWGKYLKTYSTENKFRRVCISGIQIWYNDQLCTDIGCNPKRKKGFLRDLLEAYGSNDYKGLAPEN